jgi:secreted Zn-dependent insulinase-like peptidase
MNHNGIELAWGGYNDAIPAFINGTLEKLVNLSSNLKEHSFNQARQKLALASENYYLGNTYQLAMGQMGPIMLSGLVEEKQLHSVLSNYSFNKFQLDLQSWLKSG